MRFLSSAIFIPLVLLFGFSLWSQEIEIDWEDDDTEDATVETAVETTLPKIELEIEKKRSFSSGAWSNGVYMGGTGRNIKRIYRFSVPDKIELQKVSYFGTNLANVVKPVPESYRLMKSYKTKRLTGLGFYLAGASLLVTGLTNFKPGEGQGVPVLPFVGAGVMWVGYFVGNPSKSVFEQVVKSYNNRHISEKD